MIGEGGRERGRERDSLSSIIYKAHHHSIFHPPGKRVKAVVTRDTAGMWCISISNHRMHRGCQHSTTLDCAFSVKPNKRGKPIHRGFRYSDGRCWGEPEPDAGVGMPLASCGRRVRPIKYCRDVLGPRLRSWPQRSPHAARSGNIRWQALQALIPALREAQGVSSRPPPRQERRGRV